MASSNSPKIAVIGGGPAGLMAAEVAAQNGAAVTIFERMPSVARKFLLAGRGGLNLTHNEARESFLTHYGRSAPKLAASLTEFDPAALRFWCEDLGISTFVGSSGRVFPATMKTSPLLRAWLRRLDALGVRFAFRHVWEGWDGDGRLLFATPKGPAFIDVDAVVLALGGASWPHLGSDGGWVDILNAAKIKVTPLVPANCGFTIAWSVPFRSQFEGEALKSIAIEFDGVRVRGDAVVTKRGLEGGSIYALAEQIRDAIAFEGSATVRIALRPGLSRETLTARLAKRRPKESLSNTLRKTLGLTPVAIGLLHEVRLANSGPGAPVRFEDLPQLVNALPLRLDAPTPLARAISTGGGLDFAELDQMLMLRDRPGVFAAGEMLDWEAPTGGYLLQACFATGRTAGLNAVHWAQKAAATNAKGMSPLERHVAPDPVMLRRR